MLFSAQNEEPFEPKESWVYKLLGKVMPISSKTDHEHFIIKKENKTLVAVSLLFFAVAMIIGLAHFH